MKHSTPGPNYSQPANQFAPARSSPQTTFNGRGTTVSAPPQPPPVPQASSRPSVISPVNLPRSSVVSPPTVPQNASRNAQYGGMNLRNTNKSPTPGQLQNQIQQLRGGRDSVGANISRQGSRDSISRSNSMNGRETPASFR